MDITVTFPAGPSGALALVRFKQPGRMPEFRSLPLSGPLDEEMETLLAFIWSHLDEGTAHQRQGWLWEA